MFSPRTYAKQGHSVATRFAPSADLAGCIRSFEYREVAQAGDGLHPLAFSVFPFISFYLGAPCDAFEHPCGAYRPLPRVSVVGPCDHRVADFRHGPGFKSLRVVFEPTGFFRMLHISPCEVANFAHDGVDVLGSRAGALHARLCEAPSPQLMVQAVEEQLRAWCGEPSPASAITLAANKLLRTRGKSDLGAVARSLGVSDSSWRRHFSAEIGVTPKRYLRVLRFERAVGLKFAFPDWSWTEVCLESGYYDQAHFITDCHTIAHCTPSSLMRDIANMPAPLAKAFYGQAVDDREQVRPLPPVSDRPDGRHGDPAGDGALSSFAGHPGLARFGA
jgi:AraC-like DNA-binding protein